MTPEFLLVAVAVPVLIVGLLTLPFVDVGVNLADEGYLLLGSNAVLDGQVPIRDFRAYDPGRYYWCALWLKFLGRKYSTLRLAMAFIMFCSLSLSAMTIYLATADMLICVVVCLLCFVWMRPHHKQIEIFFSLAIVFLLGHVDGIGIVPGALVLGVVIGGSLFFGLNIFLYVSGATALVTAVQPADWLLMADRTAFMWLVVGLCAGLAPFGCLLIINAGMARAYWEKKVMTILRRGRTNLRLPLPWIWAWHVPQLNRLDLPRRWFFKSVFTASPLIYGGIIAGYAVSPTRSDQPTMELAVVASCTGLVYLHHVLSRADVAHMSQALHPLLIAICAAVSVLVPSHWAILLVLLLACSSAWALLPHFDERFQFLVARTRYRRFSTSAETLRLHQRTAAQLTYLGHLIDRHSRKGEAIFAAPQLAGFFPLFERSPAAYDTFPVYPASRSEQLSMIEQLERANTRMAIIRDVPVDRREDLRFSSNYDLVFEYLQKKFHKLPNNDLIENYFVFVSHDHRSIT